MKHHQWEKIVSENYEATIETKEPWIPLYVLLKS